MLQLLKNYDHRLWNLALGWFTSSLGFALVIPFIAIYFHGQGMTLTQIGLFFGITAVIRATVQAYGGELSDQVGRYRLMIVAQLCRAVVFVFLAAAVHYSWGLIAVGALIIINFIFGALFQPAANSTVADLVGNNRRTEAFAIVRAAGNLGWAVGPAIGGYMAASSLALLLLLSGIITAMSGFIILFFLKGIVFNRRADANGSFRQMFIIKGNETMFHHAGLLFILYLVVAHLMAPLSLYSVDFRGLAESQLGHLYMLNGLIVVFLQLPMARLMRPFRLTSQMAAGAFVYAVGYFLVGLSAEYAMFIVSMIIITSGELLISPPALAITANLAPPDKVGRYMGIYGFAVTAGWSLGPLVGTLLLDLFKPEFVFSWGTIAVLAVVAGMGFIRLHRHIAPEVNTYRDIIT
jgi:MFS family permease